MKKTLKIFIIPCERIPAGLPNPAIEKEIEAPTVDLLREKASEYLKSEGFRIRSISFSPVGMTAYVEDTK